MPRLKQDDYSMDDFGVFLEQLCNSESLIFKLEDEIKELKTEIGVKFRDMNIDTGQLKMTYSRLSNGRHKLLKQKEQLNLHLKSNVIDEIFKKRELCAVKQTEVNRILLFSDFFEAISNITGHLEDSKECFKNKDFWKSCYNITQAKEIHEKLSTQKDVLFLESKCLDTNDLINDYDFVLNKLKIDIDMAYEEFLFDLIQMFKKSIVFEENVFHFNFFSNLSEEQYDDYIKCILNEKEEFVLYFKNCFEQINQSFIKPILTDNKSCLFTSENIKSDSHCWRNLKIQLVESDKDTKPLQNLKKLIENVINTFTIEHTTASTSSLIEFVSEFWPDQIFTYIINFNFERSIQSEFDSFAYLLKECNELEQFMKTLGVLNGEYNPVLRNYSDNIKEHFSTKLCQDSILRIKRIVKSELSDVVSSEKAIEKLNYTGKTKFPVCKISNFMIEIQDLFEEMSAQLANCSENLKIHLVETFYDVCEIFIDISPFIHKDRIETDASDNAIFHNNCLYFGYLIECVVLKHKQSLDSLFELVPFVRNLASQIFLNQMKFHEQILISLIKDESFNDCLLTIASEISSTDVKVSSHCHFQFRQCINNCLKHLYSLHNSFNGVLPDRIYSKAFATLINSFLNKFLSAIILLEDISSLAASHLSQELEYFSKELKLFLGNSEDLVSKWLKMNEIIFILKSSLLQIVNRWADGKGLLANYLTVDEVKHLIRALFQNNERRSNALARIK